MKVGAHHATVLVGRNGGGSTTHFYHFMLQYFLPAVHYVLENPRENIVLEDCGPLNRWFYEHLDETKFRVETRQSVALRVALGLFLPPVLGIDRKMIRSVLSPENLRLVIRILVGLALKRPNRDFRRAVRQGAVRLERRKQPGFFLVGDYRRVSGEVQEQLAEVTGALKQRLSAEGEPTEAVRPTIVLIDRNTDVPEYYSENEQGSYGKNRRNIPNIPEIAEMLLKFGEVETVIPENLSTAAAIAAFGRAHVLVGQHGAGLANMVWMAQSSKVLELTYPGKGEKYFLNLAAVCDHDFLQVMGQEGPHDRVEPRIVEDAILSLLASNLKPPK